jgi:hypothetical protein
MVKEEAMGAGGSGIVRVQARVLVRTTLIRKAKWKAREHRLCVRPIKRTRAAPRLPTAYLLCRLLDEMHKIGYVVCAIFMSHYRDIDLGKVFRSIRSIVVGETVESRNHCMHTAKRTTHLRRVWNVFIDLVQTANFSLGVGMELSLLPIALCRQPVYHNSMI